ncbi:unnamed protein product [Dovyalis caffra]|uniref:Uncharacterized protein n=1 Tax=Dovyalis caffra TaxID=77055 RepID=A0AAV1SGP7_9ROSI|nr:unnamed protein product [Dovyalis caffra]
MAVFPSTVVAMASILSIFVFCFPTIVTSASFGKIFLPPTDFGPESVAFESPGGAFYTGVNDGPISGRPFGLAYNPITRLLCIDDAYYGLLVANSNGSLAGQIATSAEGQPFVFLNAIYIDPSVDRDGSYLLVSEALGNRIRKYWLTGPRANTAEILLSNINIVRPQNIKRTTLGDFWVAAATVKQGTQTLAPIRVRVDGSGRISEIVSLEAQYGSTLISEVQASGLALYEPVEGKIVIKSPSSISHYGIRLSVNGSVNLQVRGGSAGVLESLYGVVKPITIVNKSIEVRQSGKIDSGTNECLLVVADTICCGFETNRRKNLERFYETFHGTNISIQYLVTVDIARGYLHKSLSTTMEVIVESDKADLLERPVSSEMAIFYITQDTQRHPLLPELKSGGFRVTGRMSTLCSLLDPISGDLTVEASAVPISSIDIHLLRVESILMGEKIVTETSLIQTTQIADGDVCRNLTLPIYVILPRLLTCPSVFAGPFSIEFKVSIVISFQSELSKLHKKSDPRTPRLWLALETLPLELFRTR